MSEAHNTERRLTAASLLVLVVAVVVLGAVLLGAGLKGGSGVQARTITVTGTGTVTASPNTAAFTLDVVTTGTSVDAALAANDAIVARAIARARADGVTSPDLTPSALSTQPVSNAQGVTTGYQADAQLSVTTHRVDRLGRLLADLSSVAGDTGQLSGVTFSLSRDSTATDEARVRAIEAARHQALVLTRAARVSLGAVRTITDQEGTGPIIWPSPIPFASAAQAGPRVPIAAGSQSVSVTVTVVYSLG